MVDMDQSDRIDWQISDIANQDDFLRYFAMLIKRWNAFESWEESDSVQTGPPYAHEQLARECGVTGAAELAIFDAAYSRGLSAAAAMDIEVIPTNHWQNAAKYLYIGVHYE